MAGGRIPHDGGAARNRRRQLHGATIGSQTVEVPIVPVAAQTAVALLNTGDLPMSFVDRAAAELADRLWSSDPDAIVAAATGGVPIGVAVAAEMGHDQCAILHKSAEIHLGGSLTEWVEPTSAGGVHRHRLDVSRAWLIEGRRVAFVDDVVSTGASVAAALRLIRRAGGEVVAVGVLATEGTRWLDTLGDDAHLVRSLGSLPRFGLDPELGWVVATERERPRRRLERPVPDRGRGREHSRIPGSDRADGVTVATVGPQPPARGSGAGAVPRWSRSPV